MQIIQVFTLFKSLLQSRRRRAAIRDITRLDTATRRDLNIAEQAPEVVVDHLLRLEHTGARDAQPRDPRLRRRPGHPSILLSPRP